MQWLFYKVTLKDFSSLRLNLPTDSFQIHTHCKKYHTWCKIIAQKSNLFESRKARIRRFYGNSNYLNISKHTCMNFYQYTIFLYLFINFLLKVHHNSCQLNFVICRVKILS